MVLEIKSVKGRWLVNGKRLNELNAQEKHFMDEFFKEVKIKQDEEAQLCR